MPITTRHEWLTPPTINKYYALDLAPDRSQQHEIRRDPHIVLGNHLQPVPDAIPRRRVSIHERPVNFFLA